FKFNATDNQNTPKVGGNQYNDSILGYNYTVEKDDMNITYISGNESFVWRNGTDEVTFSIEIRSIDQNNRLMTPGEANATVWVTKNHDQANFSNVTDEGGISNGANGLVDYDFNPDGSCEFDVGIQYWVIGTQNNIKFKDTNSTTQWFEIWSYLNGTINTPNGEGYERKAGNNVPMNFTAYDECQNPVSGLKYKKIWLFGPQNYTVENGSITDNGDGTYFHNWSTTVPSPKAMGNYNMTVVINKSYYIEENLTRYSAFDIATGPQLQYPSPPIYTSSGDGGWGETWEFKVQCRDEEGDTFNISLWKRRGNTTEWEFYGIQSCQSWPTWSTKTFIINDFDCSNVTPSGEYSWFKFNTSDQWNFSAETSEQDFIIYRDDINVIITDGYQVNIDRNGTGSTYNDTELFAVQINDTDRGNIHVEENVSGRFYITTDGTTFNSVLTNQTNASGHLNYNFNPDCTYGFGPQKWIGGTYNDSCYEDKNSSASGHDFTIYGQLKNNIDIPTQGSNFNVTDNITIRLNVTSDCSAEGRINQTNVYIELRSPYGNWTNCTPILNESGSNSG
ncbi:MAG: hypothetical protein KAU24_00705, partial [Candidatus Aenigmarchaeota archaeon]|nr:hypothetical protein [Candidatus Aenigmarchaeota archaeon]